MFLFFLLTWRQPDSHDLYPSNQTRPLLKASKPPRQTEDPGDVNEIARVESSDEALRKCGGTGERCSGLSSGEAFRLIFRGALVAAVLRRVTSSLMVEEHSKAVRIPVKTTR